MRKQGTQSTWGKGQTGPDPKQSIKLGDMTVPLGKGVDTGARAQGGGYTLQYNEFIVYDTSRVRFKYLVKVRFDYKR
jgi:poly [ADP-ribose] polymerase